MEKPAPRGLLPEGLHDTLSPAAEQEFGTVVKLMTCFASHGYEQVAPPVVEFEESLLAGMGAVESERMFRLMDPSSHKMMGVRTDMTTQVARIATTRLKGVPRPLRLCYAGQVLRTKGGQVRTEREIGQAGIELIGITTIAAEAEVLLLAAEALRAVGVEAFNIDLTLPKLVPAICDGLGANAATAERARAALDQKHIAALEALDGDLGAVLRRLSSAAGPAENALKTLRALKVPDKAAAMIKDLDALVAEVLSAAPSLELTIDPGEYRGFEYQTGVGFTLFAAGQPSEVGRGGHYLVYADGGREEPAMGFSVYINSLMRALPGAATPRRVFLPAGIPLEKAIDLRAAGWRTVGGLEAKDDVPGEARRMGCSHYFDGKTIVVA